MVDGSGLLADGEWAASDAPAPESSWNSETGEPQPLPGSAPEEPSAPKVWDEQGAPQMTIGDAPADAETYGDPSDEASDPSAYGDGSE